MPVTGFLAELSADSPAPGGGSVAALCGAVSSSLTAMVAALTYAKQDWEDSRPAMEQLGRSAQELGAWFVRAVDRDADAFNRVIAARRLPRATDEERETRLEAIAAANLQAAVVPLEVLEHAAAALELAVRAARDGNPSSVSDAGVAGLTAAAAAYGASLNVRINLPGLANGEQETIRKRHDAALADVPRLRAELESAVEQVFED